ncbi:MAG: arylsulfatase, partial [Raoultibacter sp.]
MSKKRLCITLFDLASITLLATYAVLVFAPPAYAYVDPSVMTYAIQAFAGVAVALGAVAGVALRRTRKMLFKALSIDENANKIVEADVHRLDADGNPIGVVDSASSKREDSKISRKRAGAHGSPVSLGWKSRLVYAFAVSLFFAYTVFVVAPLEIVASNASSLIFDVSDVWVPVALGALVIVVVLVLVLSVLRGRAFEVCLLIVFSLGLGAYVQAMFMNSSLPAADGAVVVWEDYQTAMVISALVWITIVVIPLVVRHWFSSACRGVAVAVGLCLIVVQSVGLASLFIQPAASEGNDPLPEVSAAPVATEEGMYDVSPQNNVVVFVLDTVD